MLKKHLLQFTSLLKGLFKKKPNKSVAELIDKTKTELANLSDEKLESSIISYKSVTESIDKTKTELANLSDEKLESSILSYETWYFECIGEHHPEVIEFRTAIEQKNIQLITEKWSDFYMKFIGYERSAGITGRPYIFDCYSSYHFSLEEFEKRQRNK